jgi:hypothetical protein
MKLVNHNSMIIAIIEHQSEKAYLTSQQGKQAWVPLFTADSQDPVAEIDLVTRQVRICARETIPDQLEVVLHDN